MRRDEVIAKLRRHRAEIHRLGVNSLYLFGSTARDEAGVGSDVDLYFDFGDPSFSLIELAELKRRLTEMLGAPADVMSRGSLHPRLRENIEIEALQVF